MVRHPISVRHAHGRPQARVYSGGSAPNVPPMVIWPGAGGAARQGDSVPQSWEDWYGGCRSGMPASELGISLRRLTIRRSTAGACQRGAVRVPGRLVGEDSLGARGIGTGARGIVTRRIATGTGAMR